MGEKIMTKEYGLCAACANRRTCRDKDPLIIVVDDYCSYVDDGCERCKVTKRKGRRNDK